LGHLHDCDGGSLTISRGCGAANRPKVPIVAQGNRTSDSPSPDTLG